MPKCRICGCYLCKENAIYGDYHTKDPTKRTRNQQPACRDCLERRQAKELRTPGMQKSPFLWKNE